MWITRFATAVHLTAATPSTDREAVDPVSSRPDGDKAASTSNRGLAATAAFISTPSDGDKDGWQTPSIALTPSSSAEREAWSDTVETFKRLLAEQKASQASELKQTENERVLGQIEAWSNAKAR
jgi:hypothetical protein